MHSRTALSPLKLAVIKKANDNTELFARNRAQGCSDTDTLAAVIRNPKKKVIVGTWGDETEADRCGVLIIRGASSCSDLEAVSGDNMDAIHCSCAEEALAMRQVFGDDAKPLH
jgi:hypothetical protein